MTRATRCDRCYGFEVGDPVVKVETRRTDDHGTTKTKPYDLCAPCIAGLIEYLEPVSEDAPMREGGV